MTSRRSLSELFKEMDELATAIVDAGEGRTDEDNMKLDALRLAEAYKEVRVRLKGLST